MDQSTGHRSSTTPQSLRLLGEASRRLTRWLVEDAYQVWWQLGADKVHGGFHERLQQNGQPTDEPRRARLHPRHIYSFSLADELGHDGLTELATRHALEYFLRHYVRDDHFIRTCVAPEMGCIVEPGHQFEWAWLLLRWNAATQDARAASMALALVDTAERRGVDARRGVAVNSLLTDGNIRDGRARLWPQAERLKAACLAWEATRLPTYCDIAREAAVALERYLQTTTRGLWRDTMTVDGGWIDEPAPASSLYHVVSAIAELDCLINRISEPITRAR